MFLLFSIFSLLAVFKVVFLNNENLSDRQEDKRKTSANSRFAKAGVSCFYDSEVLNSSFVQLMKFSAENPRLRKPANRYGQVKQT